MYKLYAKYLNGSTEFIDESDSKSEANYLKEQYELAFGPNFTITIKEED